jgi:MFS family permease
MDKRRLLAPDLVVLSGAFFFIFLGPGSIQQHLDKIIGDKRFYVLATLYGSFCFWRVFVGVTIRVLGDFLSELLGAATYMGFAATMLLSTSWPAVLVAAALWGWGACSLWIASQSQVLDATRRHGASSGLLYTLVAGGQALGVGLLALIASRWAPTAGWRLDRVLPGVCVALGLPGLVLICLVPRRRVERRAFSLAAFWRIARQRAIVLVGIIQFCSSLSYGILLGVFSELARTATGGQVPAVAYYAARVPLCFPAGALADRIGKERVLKLSFLLAALGILIAALWRSSPGLSLSICAAAMAAQNTLVASGAMAMMGRVATSEGRHMALGAVFFWRDLGVAIPLFVAGALKGLLADPLLVVRVFRHSLFVFAGIFLASAFLCDALRRAVERHQEG